MLMHDPLDGRGAARGWSAGVDAEMAATACFFYQFSYPAYG
jgi:hypothetical protein